MKLGMIGLGRMGGAMAQRLMSGGHQVVAYDQSHEVVDSVVEAGAERAVSLADVVRQLDEPRTIWVMVPAGDATESAVNTLVDLMSPGDTIIDGGNSNYKETQARASQAAAVGIDLLDSGTSGGVWGRKNGYCITVGGNRQAYDRNLPIFQSLAPEPEKGQMWVGPNGSGHFVKMVHNGIEYGMMQAMGEGFELLAAKDDFDLDLAAISENWRYGSVIRSWLLDLGASALNDDPDLSSLSSYVEDSGEGRWTVDASVELAVPAPVITAALQYRFRSRQEDPIAGRMLAALRQQFGGHTVKRQPD